MSAGFISGAGCVITAHRIEFCGREGDPGEHLAGIFGAAGIVTAFLCGQTVIQHRHDQLSGAFQTDDGELPQCYEEPAAVAGQYQLLIEHSADAGRDLADGIAAAAVAYLPDRRSEDHGIQHFHCGHQIAR